MSKPLVGDELWAVVEPLLPQEPPKPKGGRPRISDRAALSGSGMTCWRRLRDWHQAGVGAAIHAELLRRLQHADKLDWSRAALDSASVAAKRGAPRPGRIRRIAAKRARSATLWSSGAGSRSP